MDDTFLAILFVLIFMLAMTIGYFMGVIEEVLMLVIYMTFFGLAISMIHQIGDGSKELSKRDLFEVNAPLIYKLEKSDLYEV